ncbi:MAG TPA: hypothetical protein PKY05_18765, partial [Fibrobacteria bacterium]|nr:hypothetical protein [Fibrobacteria bacterium]
HAPVAPAKQHARRTAFSISTSIGNAVLRACCFAGATGAWLLAFWWSFRKFSLSSSPDPPATSKVNGLL